MTTTIYQSTIKSWFDEVYQGRRNVMTPWIVKYGKAGSFFYELSKGNGIMPDTTIYGVTVISYDPKTREVTKMHELSQGGFETIEGAKAYIKELK